jgi:oligosaccharide repeat unit polymerase
MVRERAIYVLWLLLAVNACAIYFDPGMNLAIRTWDVRELAGELALARIQGELLGTSHPLFMGIFRYAYGLYIPLLSLMWRKKWISTAWFIVICVTSAITCLSTFTRAPLVHLIVVIFISLFVVFPERRSKLLTWVTLLAFIAVGGFLSMQTLLSGSESVTDEAFSDSVVGYVGGPMKAYDMLLEGEYPVQRGFYSMDMVNFPLHRLGLIGSYPSLVRDEVSVPFGVNVYTFLDAFTLDFGVLGAILGAFGIGVLVAVSYSSAIRQSYVGLTAYGLGSSYLVMAGLNNEFIRFDFAFYILLAWLIQRVICPGGREYRGVGSEVGAISVRSCAS